MQKQENDFSQISMFMTGNSETLARQVLAQRNYQHLIEYYASLSWWEFLAKWKTKRAIKEMRAKYNFIY